MAVDPIVRVEFILRAIEHAQERIVDVLVDDFGEDHTLVEATLFDLAVIGKAARLLPNEVTSACPTVPWSELAGLWDIVVNHCMNFEINPIRVWNTVVDELVPLIPHLRAIVTDVPGGSTTTLEDSIDGYAHWSGTWS